MNDCLFCKIIAGEIPSKKVYEDEICFAFYDISPLAPMHFLVVPKLHLASAAEVTDENAAVIGHIYAVIAKLAKEMGFADGETVRVSTKKGSLTIPVETTWQTCRGYCLIPHHMGLMYEGRTYGTHINYLTDHRDIDELTGNAKWRYTPCRVEKIQEV